MTPTRRTLLKGSVAALAAPGLARALPLADVAIHDGRPGMAPPALRTIDLSEERRARWANIRAGLGDARSVSGMTRWSDYVMIAHELERRGFRRKAEAAQGPLWHWRMERSR